MNLLSRRVAAYLDELVPPRHPRLAELEVEARRTGFPIIGPATGHLCYLLTRLSNARHVFELGSGFGYSTAWFARAVKENGGGIVHHVVWDDRLSREARENLVALGLADVVQFHVGEAVATLQQAPGPFDVIFNDIDKQDYPKALDVIATKLRPGGLLLVDNILWSGRIFERRDTRRARADAADSGGRAVDCVRDPRARRPAGCAARGGAIGVVGYWARLGRKKRDELLRQFGPDPRLLVLEEYERIPPSLPQIHYRLGPLLEILFFVTFVAQSHVAEVGGRHERGMSRLRVRYAQRRVADA